MPATVNLQVMSVPEKLRLMEALWSDLSKGENLIDSPEWHGDILTERDRTIHSGEEAFVDLEIAKKKLRSEL